MDGILRRACGTMGAVLLTVTPAPAATNLALNDPVTGSTWYDAPSDSGNWHYRNLTDGQTDDAWGNIWLLPNGTAGWATVDLGAVQTLSRVRFQGTTNQGNDDRGARDYRVFLTNSYSTNLADYGAPLASGQLAAPASLPVPVPFVELKYPAGASGRYLTVAVDSWYGGGGGLGEIEAYDAPLNSYLDPTKVNLLRRVDGSGALPTVTASRPGSGDHTPNRLIDAGLYPWRLDSHGASEWWRIELPEAVPMDTFVMRERGGFYGTAYTLRGSATDFASLQTLWGADVGGPLTVSGNTNPTRTHLLRDPADPTRPALVKCLEVQITGFASGTYFIPHEYQAYGPGTVWDFAGYNLFAKESQVGALTASMQRKLMDTDTRRVVDLDMVNTYVRGQNTGSGNCWFVMPLAEATECFALSVGMYEDQYWNDARVYVSGDATYSYLDVGGVDTWPGMTWDLVYDHPAGLFSGAHVPFARRNVSFVRVEWPSDARASGAMTELELFAIPEPVSALLLAGFSLVGARRRPAAAFRSRD